MPRRPTLILASTERSGVQDALDAVIAATEPFADITQILAADDAPIPENHGAERAIAIGGDGTLISQARRLLGHDLPLIGVNIGRLGFLAEFDPEDLSEHGLEVFGDDPPVARHIVLDATVTGADGVIRHRGQAINDTVITSGPPFRMIELQMQIDEADGPTLTGDGVIVATPAGSTAYNVSAGGPIVHPASESLVITPLAAHSLAFRPIVVDSTTQLRIRVGKANEGSALVQDGHAVCTLAVGDTVDIATSNLKALLVRNPRTTYWEILLDKMRWAAPPSYRR